MVKSIFEKMGGTYHEENGYLIPDLTLPTEEENPIGIWGQRHLRYIKKHKRLFYVNLLTSGGLNSYLADINEQAEEMFLRLIKQGDGALCTISLVYDWFKNHIQFPFQ